MIRMLRRRTICVAAVLGLGLGISAARGDDPSATTGKGTPPWKSAGAMSFGPGGLLFVGDATGGAIYAIETGDVAPDGDAKGIEVKKISGKVAALLGVEPADLVINDLAVNPASKKAYLSVSRGRGVDAQPALVRVGRSGEVELVTLDDRTFSKAPLVNLPAATAAPSNGAPARKGMGGGGNPRSQAITDLAFVDGRVYVAGLSNEEFSSRFVSIPYPFAGSDSGTSVEFFHGAHGRFETRSPIRTFAPYTVDGKPFLMAAYTCTPLVRFPLDQMKPGSHYKASTVAELGNRNTPLDMVVYRKDGKDYILMANTTRGMMKIKTEGVAEAESITGRVADTAGLPYEKVDGLQGVEQLDKFDDANALVIIRRADGAVDLETAPLP